MNEIYLTCCSILKL